MIEQIISLLAPHYCRVCMAEGAVLCEACVTDAMQGITGRCYVCEQIYLDTICPGCAPKTPIRKLWISASYEGELAQVIREFKFERVKGAAKPLAAGLSHILPYLEDVVVVPVVTAPPRIRMRGYDQTLLLAQELYKITKLPYAEVLKRNHNARQLGASKKQRRQQAQTAFRAYNTHFIKGRHILLIDDVMTTGATLEAAAEVLLQAGAKRVDAAVIAWQAASNQQI